MKTTIKAYLLTVLSVASTCIAWAQPAAVKKAAESVFTITTFKEDGSLLASGHGVFVGSNGEAISSLAPFIGAKKAVVIDSKGKKLDVTRLLGANSLYDVIRFKVDGSTKPAAIASTPARQGESLWLVPYATKGGSATQASVKSVEKFMDKYSYYIFSFNAPSNTESCPFINAKGEIVGLMQASTTNSDVHATDAKFISSLTTNGLSINDDTFRKIGIPTALPATKDQAMVTLMLSGQINDSVKYAAAVNDFLAAYPTAVDGYVAKAQMEVEARNFGEADKVMKAALDKVSEKDNVHYNYSRLIFQKASLLPEVPYEAWTFDKALTEIEQALSISPLPLYQYHKAQVLYGKAEYQKAYDMYMKLAEGDMKKPDLYYQAALCKQQMKAPKEEVIVLLDSAVNNVDSLNVRDAADYFLMRGNIYNEMGKYRQAVFDYTRYEVIDGKVQSASFYYAREQAEINAKLFKQAITDINNAILLAPEEPMFHAERASLLLRLNKLDEALKSANKSVELAPDYSDAYLIIGLISIRNGNKQEGIATLEKAKALGNAQADALIKKYK